MSISTIGQKGQGGREEEAGATRGRKGALGDRALEQVSSSGKGCVRTGVCAKNEQEACKREGRTPAAQTYLLGKCSTEKAQGEPEDQEAVTVTPNWVLSRGHSSCHEV